MRKSARVGERNALSSHCGCGCSANGGGSSMGEPPEPGGAWYVKTGSDGGGAYGLSGASIGPVGELLDGAPGREDGMVKGGSGGSVRAA